MTMRHKRVRREAVATAMAFRSRGGSCTRWTIASTARDLSQRNLHRCRRSRRLGSDRVLEIVAWIMAGVAKADSD